MELAEGSCVTLLRRDGGERRSRKVKCRGPVAAVVSYSRGMDIFNRWTGRGFRNLSSLEFSLDRSFGTEFNIYFDTQIHCKVESIAIL